MYLRIGIDHADKPYHRFLWRGIDETMVKSAKMTINAILGNEDVNDEESMTEIVGTEGLINFRPLTY
ncbi:hypothetical protein DPMN_118891 [Dreissena polymorpha]|uniref:Uncharacterized protein n=1 Tax=Dreissena polymorpha TaxID=45954 RepID=A0A9D4GI80_DREPO|nr:hypothetical protein DPMN_118891 [Dreissena polymorpha]